MRSFYLVIAITLILALTSSVFLFAPGLLPEHLKNDMSGRIGIAQLSIETASVVALFLAAWEFWQAQKRPKLRIGIEPLKTNKMFFDESSEIIVNSKDHRQSQENFPSICFSVFLDNFGDVMAKWVRVTLEVIDPFGYSDMTLLGDGNLSDFWKPKLNYNYYSKRYVFSSGDDYVSYSHSPKVANAKEWMDHLATFRLMISPWDGGANRTVKIKCYIEASEFPRKEETFLFHVKMG